VHAISQIPYKKLVWLLPLVLAFHEFEEWNIKAWNTANFTNTPDTPENAIRVLLVLVAIVGFLATAFACSFKSPSRTAYFSLTFFILVAFNNSLQHIYWQLSWGTYAPGVIAAALLNIPAILLLSWHALANKLVSPIYLAILYMSSVPTIFLTHRQGRIFPEAMQKGHEFGIQIISLL
jgi:hypothetical protein